MIPGIKCQIYIEFYRDQLKACADQLQAHATCPSHDTAMIGDTMYSTYKVTTDNTVLTPNEVSNRYSTSAFKSLTIPWKKCKNIKYSTMDW